MLVLPTVRQAALLYDESPKLISVELHAWHYFVFSCL